MADCRCSWLQGAYGAEEDPDDDGGSQSEFDEFDDGVAVELPQGAAPLNAAAGMSSLAQLAEEDQAAEATGSYTDTADANDASANEPPKELGPPSPHFIVNLDQVMQDGGMRPAHLPRVRRSAATAARARKCPH
jgi:hypothetical protein